MEQRPCALFGMIVAALLVAAPVLCAAAGDAAPTAAGTDTVPAAPPAAADVAAQKPAEPQPPVRISADQAEYFNKEGFVVFTGHVVAVQADATISADRMEVFFEKPAAAAGRPAAVIAAPTSAQRMTKIVALDKVTFRQADPDTGKERYATGAKGVYDVEQRFVTMSGSPRLWEGKNVIDGEEMVFYLVEKKVTVKGNVKVTVFPDDLKEGKKP